MLHNEYGKSWWVGRNSLIAIALVLGALVICGFAAASSKTGGALPAAPNKDHVYTQVFQHSYDEVFQAAQDSVERLGWFVTGTDKVKGIVSCRFSNSSTPMITFDLQVETVSQKPETQVTIVFIKTGRTSKDSIWQTLSTELQKVLSTYR